MSRFVDKCKYSCIFYNYIRTLHPVSSHREEFMNRLLDKPSLLALWCSLNSTRVEDLWIDKMSPSYK